MKKSDLERLKKVVSTWNALQNQMNTHCVTRELLMEDEYSQWAVTTPLYNIGEHVYCLTSDFKEQYPDLPWKAVSGIRHRLVHDYEGINWSVIVEVVFDEMPGFIASVQAILREKEAEHG